MAVRNRGDMTNSWNNIAGVTKRRQEPAMGPWRAFDGYPAHTYRNNETWQDRWLRKTGVDPRDRDK